VIRETLPNGIRLVARASGPAPVVSMALFLAAGSASEAATESGVSALLARVAIKGTRHRTALEVARTAEDAGGGIESATDQEYVELRVGGLARHWREMLDLLCDVGSAPRLADEEVTRERAVLLGQIHGLEDEPGHVAGRLLARALYGPSGYGLPASGEVETVGRLGGEALARRFQAGWVPAGMVLVVSGAVPVEEVLVEARWRLAGWRAGAPPPALPVAPARPVESQVQEVRPTQQAHLLVGFLAPAVGNPDHTATKVMTAILGGGMSSRLFRRLRDEQGLAYSVGAVYPTRRGSGRIVIHIATAPANLAAAEAGIREEVARLAGEALLAEELARAKTQMIGALALDCRTSARQTFYRGAFELMGVGADYLEQYGARVEAVSAADVQRVAQRYLADPARVVVGPA
jgi:predicted Zn-dependent peptidase